MNDDDVKRVAAALAAVGLHQDPHIRWTSLARAAIAALAAGSPSDPPADANPYRLVPIAAGLPGGHPDALAPATPEYQRRALAAAWDLGYEAAAATAGSPSPAPRPISVDGVIEDLVRFADEHPCSGSCLGCGAGVDEPCYGDCRCDEGTDCEQATAWIAYVAAVRAAFAPSPTPPDDGRQALAEKWRAEADATHITDDDYVPSNDYSHGIVDTLRRCADDLAPSPAVVSPPSEAPQEGQP